MLNPVSSFPSNQASADALHSPDFNLTSSFPPSHFDQPQLEARGRLFLDIPQITDVWHRYSRDPHLASVIEAQLRANVQNEKQLCTSSGLKL